MGSGVTLLLWPPYSIPSTGIEPVFSLLLLFSLALSLRSAALVYAEALRPDYA
jgi:hypothetical protein